MCCFHAGLLVLPSPSVPPASTSPSAGSILLRWILLWVGSVKARAAERFLWVFYFQPK